MGSDLKHRLLKTLIGASAIALLFHPLVSMSPARTQESRLEQLPEDFVEPEMAQEFFDTPPADCREVLAAAMLTEGFSFNPRLMDVLYAELTEEPERSPLLESLERVSWPGLNEFELHLAAEKSLATARENELCLDLPARER